MTMASYSSFSPSPTSNLSPTQQTLFKKPKSSSSSSSSSKARSLIKRQETVFRKADELSILCGIEVCVICYGPYGELKTWPEDIEKVKDMARRYSELSEKKRRRGSVNLCEFLDKINKDDAKNKNKKKKIMKEVKLASTNKYPDWDPRFEDYSLEQLMELVQSLESKQSRLKHRIRAAVEARKQNTNMSDQEQRMPTMNHHLQQHSNQVSMYLFNHGNGTFSQIPFSASAFNQSQSLPPLPTPLTIYPNSNAENYSRLLGPQETEINGFQNMNMLTHNNNCFPKRFCDGEAYSGLLGVQESEMNNPNMYSCNNINVEDYDSGLLGVQDYGMINELQDMNMCGNTNTDLSQQLVQFPAQYRYFNLDHNIRPL